ncbi:MAG: hypothetical protein AAGC82_06775 [Pseudomonadota bacterium]
MHAARFASPSRQRHARHFAPFWQIATPRWPWHRAWVEHRRLNRLDRTALRDLGLSLADRASVRVAVIFQRMQSGR